MSIFDDILASDASFTSAGEFSEPITYKFANNTTLAFNAVVNRQPIMPAIPGQQAAFAPQHEVFLPIAKVPSKPNTNADKINYPTNIGDSASDHVILKIITQDAGGWLVRVAG